MNRLQKFVKQGAYRPNARGDMRCAVTIEHLSQPGGDALAMAAAIGMKRT
jgi:hypothetical protein